MSDSESSDNYEPEYEWEHVRVGTSLSFKIMSVVPPPLEYMSQLRTNEQEISGRQVWTGSLVLAHVLLDNEIAAKDLHGKRYVAAASVLLFCLKLNGISYKLNII